MAIINFDKSTSSHPSPTPSKEIIEQIDVNSYPSIETNISSTTPFVWASISNVTSAFIPINKGNYLIEAKDRIAIYAVLTSDAHVTGTTPSWLEGYTQRYTLQPNEKVWLENIPDNTYLCVRTDTNSVSIPRIFKVTAEEIKIPVNLSQYTEQDCSLGGTSWYNAGNQCHIAIPVNPGEKFLIKLNAYSLPGNQVGYFVFVTSNYNPPYSLNDSIPVVSECPARLTAQKQLLISAEAPSDAAYLILTMVDGGNGRADWSLWKCI